MSAELPPSPGAGATSPQTDPATLNPDLATLAFAKELVKAIGVPADVSKPLVVRESIFQAINHIPPTYGILKDENGIPVLDETGKKIWIVTDPGNPTGYDCTLRLAVYRQLKKESVNINGKWFNSLMTFLSKPKIVIQGLPQGGDFENDNDPGFLSRIWGRLTGRSAEQTNGAK